MTLYDQEPVDALMKGVEEAMFLRFRSKCKYLERSHLGLGGGLGYLNECEHPKNSFRSTWKVQGQGTAQSHTPLPPCARTGCPLFTMRPLPAHIVKRLMWLASMGEPV